MLGRSDGASGFMIIHRTKEKTGRSFNSKPTAISQMSRGVRQAGSSQVVMFSRAHHALRAWKRLDHTRARSHTDNMRMGRRFSAVDQRGCGLVIIW